MFIAAIVGALVGALGTGLLARLRHARVPDWLGFVNLTHVRAVAGVTLGITGGAAIQLSTSDHSHHAVTYAGWYGGAVLALIVAVAATIAIERAPSGSKATAEPAREAGIGQATADTRTEVGGIHEKHLHDWLDKLAHAVNTRQATPNPGEQRRRALHAHFPDLTDPCAEWDAAVARAATAPAAARAQVESRVAAAGAPAGYNHKKLAEIVASHLVAGVGYHALFRAVRDELGGDGLQWSVYAADNLGVEARVSALPDAPLQEIQARLSADEATLQVIADTAREHADLLPAIAASRAELDTFQQPLLNTLATKQAVSPILSAASCPYCEAQLQLAA